MSRYWCLLLLSNLLVIIVDIIIIIVISMNKIFIVFSMLTYINSFKSLII